MSTTVEPPALQSSLRLVIERELDNFFEKNERIATSYGLEFLELWRLMSRHIRGGKLLRPVLMLKTFDTLQSVRDELGGAEGFLMSAAERGEVTKIACAIELLHYAFLLHDDVIDHDLVRRGQPNLIAELTALAHNSSSHRSPEHWGEAGGILAGDLMLSAAHQLFARIDVEGAMRLRLLDLLEHTITESTAGELVDVGLSRGIVSPDLSTVLTMTARKTASYTFELPLRAGAILAGGSVQLEEHLKKAGSHLGLAYQLQDDFLSTFGDATAHGKDAYSDLREGKHTAIVSFAQMTSSWGRLEADFGNPQLSLEQGERMRDLLHHCGAARFVQGLINDQIGAFHTELDASNSETPMPVQVRALLLDLVSKIMSRQS